MGWNGGKRDNVPDGVDSHLLLAHERKKGVLDQGTTNSLGGTLEQPVQFLNVIAATNAEKFEHGLVILQRQSCLVAYEWTKKVNIVTPISVGGNHLLS